MGGGGYVLELNNYVMFFISMDRGKIRQIRQIMCCLFVYCIYSQRYHPLTYTAVDHWGLSLNVIADKIHICFQSFFFVK